MIKAVVLFVNSSVIVAQIAVPGTLSPSKAVGVGAELTNQSARTMNLDGPGIFRPSTAALRQSTIFINMNLCSNAMGRPGMIETSP